MSTIHGKRFYVFENWDEKAGRYKASGLTSWTWVVFDDYAYALRNGIKARVIEVDDWPKCPEYSNLKNLMDDYSEEDLLKVGDLFDEHHGDDKWKKEWDERVRNGGPIL